MFSVVSMLSKLPSGVCWRGGGGNRLPGLVTKQAVEFPQVLTSVPIVTLNVPDFRVSISIVGTVKPVLNGHARARPL